MSTRMSTRLQVVLVVVMVLTGTCSVLFEYVNGWPSSFFPDQGLFAVTTTLVLLAYEGAGLLAWRRHPGERTGLLFSLVGWLYFVPMIGALRSSFAWTLGGLMAIIWQSALAHLGMAWPFGRLRSRFEVAVVALAYLWGIASEVLKLAFWDPRIGCRVCVANLLLVHSSPHIEQALGPVQNGVSGVVAFAVFALAVRHWLSSRGYLRRQMNLFALGGVLPCASWLVLNLLWQNGVGGVSDLTANGWGLLLLLTPPVLYVARVLRTQRAERAVGAALLGGGLAGAPLAGAGRGGPARDAARPGGDGHAGADLAASARSRTELGDAERAPAPAQLRDALARALGDASLQLVLRSEESDALVDTSGATIELASLPPGRSVTPLGEDGRAMLVYDESLGTEPELVRATASAAELVLEHARLRAEVEEQLEDVRASRARIVEAADAARRRLERDLHDGAQQRLVTLALALGMAHERAGALDPELAELLEAATAEAKEALGELRELARGIHPAVLTQAGLAGALRSLAERSPCKVIVGEVTQDRLSPAVEATAYFVVSEALANAAKHAPGSTVQVSVRMSVPATDVVASAAPGQGGGDGRGEGLAGDGDRAATAIWVEVADDGPGGARAEAGSGLTGLADRVAAAGGAFAVVSPPRGGTRLTAMLPCTPA